MRGDAAAIALSGPVHGDDRLERDGRLVVGDAGAGVVYHIATYTKIGKLNEAEEAANAVLSRPAQPDRKKAAVILEDSQPRICRRDRSTKRPASHGRASRSCEKPNSRCGSRDSTVSRPAKLVEFE